MITKYKLFENNRVFITPGMVNDNEYDKIKYLVENGADVDNYNLNKDLLATPLIDAAYLNNVEIVKILIDNGADLNKGDSDMNPLLYAVDGANYEIVELLINAGADVSMNTRDGDSPLMLANSRTMVNLLIKAGANTKHIDDFGNHFIYYYDFPNEIKEEWPEIYKEYQKMKRKADFNI